MQIILLFIYKEIKQCRKLLRVEVEVIYTGQTGFWKAVHTKACQIQV